MQIALHSRDTQSLQDSAIHIRPAHPINFQLGAVARLTMNKGIPAAL
jgi:hypothetical protein